MTMPLRVRLIGDFLDVMNVRERIKLYHYRVGDLFLKEGALALARGKFAAPC